MQHLIIRKVSGSKGKTSTRGNHDVILSSGKGIARVTVSKPMNRGLNKLVLHTLGMSWQTPDFSSSVNSKITLLRRSPVHHLVSLPLPGLTIECNCELSTMHI